LTPLGGGVLLEAISPVMVVAVQDLAPQPPAASGVVLGLHRRRGSLYVGFGKLQETMGFMEGMSVGLTMVIPAAAIALAFYFAIPCGRPVPTATSPSAQWPESPMAPGVRSRPGMTASRWPHRGGRTPANVTVTSRRTAALEGRLPAAARAWRQ
jgi:hypothetical protein